MADYESVLTDAAQLPIGDRIQLIEALWESVPPDAWPGLSPQWRAEIARRSAEFDAGRGTSIPWSEVRSELC